MIYHLFHNKKMILISSIVFLLIIYFSSLFFIPKQEEIIELEPVLQESKEEVFHNELQIDIKGAIKNPGVYMLEEGSRVQDAIMKSGGFLEEADTTSINLSKKLEDEMVIIIYTKAEIAAVMEEEVRTNKVEQTCICPKIENQACVQKPVTNVPSQESSEDNTSNEPKIVSLNKGTVSDFETLPGIGPSKAAAIIKYREEHGEFKTIEELKEVSGIGEKTFEKIKPYLTL